MLLTEILDKANTIHTRLTTPITLLHVHDICSDMNILHDLLASVRSVENRLSEIYLSCRRIARERNIDNLQNSGSSGCLGTLNAGISAGGQLKEIAPNVKIPVKIVEFISDIPDTPVYWVHKNRCFAVRINGTVFMGQVGELYTKHSAKDNIEHIRVCKHGSKCVTLFCQYWHPGEIRNFIASSWLYTHEPYNAKNKLMRHVGCRSTLSDDLLHFNSFSTSNNIENYELRKAQLIHDILVTSAMSRVIPERTVDCVLDRVGLLQSKVRGADNR